MRLEEVLAGNYAYLYHGSPIIMLMNIVNDGIIYESANNGIRCTRDINVAWGFAFKEARWRLNRGGIIVLNSQKIRTRYNISPYIDPNAAMRYDPTHTYDHEAEEIIKTKRMALDPFCVAIVCAKEDIEFISSKQDYEIAMDDFLPPSTSYDAYLKMLQKLTDYPKRVETWTRP